MMNVIEHPNGWELRVDNEEYMYFNKKDFAKGFLCHFLMDEKTYLNKDEITELVDACLRWKDKDKDKAVKELTKTKKELDALKVVYENLQKRCKNYADRLKKNGLWGKGSRKGDDDIDDDDTE